MNKTNTNAIKIDTDIIRNIVCFLKENEQYGDDWCEEIAELDKVIDFFDNNWQYYVADFIDSDGGTYSIAFKSKPNPTIDEVTRHFADDMKVLGYDNVNDFYEVDENEVYTGYDTSNIDNWPVCGY